jgi:hypothetical protein
LIGRQRDKNFPASEVAGQKIHDRHKLGSNLL